MGFLACSLHAGPGITAVTNTPTAPTAGDAVWIAAQVTGTVAVASVTLSYDPGPGGVSQTNTVFSETMGAAGAKPWTGTNCDNAWGVAYAGSKSPFEQSSNANHGGGNTNGLQFKGTTTTTNLADNTVTCLAPIDARGTSGFVEFWLETLTLSASAGWAFQLDSGAGFVTRTNELPAASHGWQFYHYDLHPGELASNLVLRFQFQSDPAATNNRVYLDQITVQTVTAGTTTTTTTTVAMLDDGLHHDGAAGDGAYGGQIPALPAGTTVRYYLTATDTGGSASTNPVGAPGTIYSYTVTTNSPTNVYYNVLLGRPTDNSIALSLLASNDLECYIAYGTQAGIYPNTTATNSLEAGAPMTVTLQPLVADHQYYYRLYYRVPGGGSFRAGADRPFHTQRAPGSSFTFIVEADPHYLDNEPPVWQRALTNMLADSPDFLVDLGDTFMGEKYYNTNSYTLSQPGIYEASRTVRDQFFSLAGHSMPVFLVNGNHDPELGWFLGNSQPTNNPPVWADTARELNYPCPIPGGFYSGSTNADPYLGGGTRDAYYAFQWGDALFVMLDNFWYSWQGVTKSGDHWAWTLGAGQYQWLKQTLETSHAKYKFVFAHHLVGGSFAASNSNDARGGLASAAYFEWGGFDTNGIYAFNAHRPGWAMPIQSLLLSNGVNAFFHGHDHLFVKEDLDVNGDGRSDLVYQECPQPSRTNYNATSAAAGYDYTNYTALQGNSGYLRVTVAPTNTTVEYVRVYLPTDEGVGKTNRMVTYRYAFPALSIASTANNPAAPTATNAVWVTATLTGSTNIAQVTLTYDGGAGPTAVTMYDDGQHQDGVPGDGIYGASIPAFPAGTVVRYYVTARYDFNRVVVDPPGSPTNTYTYAVSAGIPVVPLNGSVLLGRPTGQSITVSVVCSNDAQMFLEYGVAPGVYPNRTALANATRGQPLEFNLNQLQRDTRYYYHLIYQVSGAAGYSADTMHTFHTQRPPGSTFNFCIHGDSHPERTNNMYDPNFYTLTLNTAAADQPDFYLTIGDDFSVDNIPTNQMSQAAVVYRYTLQREYLGLVGNSAPVFLVNGNHEEASRWAFLATDLIAPGSSTITRSNIAVWAQTARNTYYPEPAPDGFYGGMTNDVLPGIGPLRSCYAWTWGDALFVTLDPYWYSTNSVDTGYGLSQHPGSDTWLVTHGDPQYFWLKSTLEQSRAKYKFVLAHHVLGTGRGGTEEAVQYEWGGQNRDGTWGFPANRPAWPDPIHQLMVANNVTAFIQGHDHIFVRQQLDGLTYQTLPNPADNRYSLFNSDAYTSNVLYKTNNTGYTRFTVAPSGVKVDYVRTILPANLIPPQVGTNGAPPGMTNGTVGYSYTILPLTAIGTANSPAAPTAADPVWVTSTVLAGTNLAQVTLTYLAGSTTNTVAMLDDGAHHDGAAGDGIYGAPIPAYPIGTRVRYYVHAVDAASRQYTDPSGAPFNTNLFSYTVGSTPTDSVGDGIPDAWRAVWFGGDGTTSNALSCAACDPDHDGVDNYHEYIADTNPTNALSYFHILGVTGFPNVTVSFLSSPSRAYTLYLRTNLAFGTWSAVAGQASVPGNGGTLMLINPAPATASMFFRVGVAVP